MRHRHPNTPARAGATLVETGIVIGAALLLILAVFEYGRFVMVCQVVENAAREGAREASAATSSATTADIQATVNRRLDGQPLQNLTIDVYRADPATGANTGDWTTATFGEGIAVKVDGTYAPMLPTFGFLPTAVPIRATSLMGSEAN